MKKQILKKFDKWFNLSQSGWETGEDIITLNGKPIGMTVRKSSKEFDRWFPDLKSKTKDFIFEALTEQEQEVIKKIKKMPSKFPEYESDYYDAGYLQAKKDIIKEINKLGVV